MARAIRERDTRVPKDADELKECYADRWWTLTSVKLYKIMIKCDDGEYEFYVHNYSDRNSKKSKQLSNSKAWVKVYGEGKLLAIYKIFRNQKGVSWNVFKIKSGKILAVDKVE